MPLLVKFQGEWAISILCELQRIFDQNSAREYCDLRGCDRERKKLSN